MSHHEPRGNCDLCMLPLYAHKVISRDVRLNERQLRRVHAVVCRGCFAKRTRIPPPHWPPIAG